MQSGETIKVLDEVGKEVEINAVVIYPTTSIHGTMYWVVKGMFGMFGNYRYTLCTTTDKKAALDYFYKVNNTLLETHERDLATRF